MKHRQPISKLSIVILLMLALCLLASCGAPRNVMTDSAVSGSGSYAEKGEDMNAVPMEPSFGMNDSALALPDMTEKAGTKVIKTFSLSAETTDFDAAIQSLNELIANHGGYVESSTTSNQSLSNKNQSYRRNANYTLRIPAEQAEAFVSTLGNSLHLTSNHSTVEDVSETYYSIEARLEELQVERSSLLEILESPSVTKDYNMWLTVKQRLSEVTQQIAVYQGQLNRYDSKIAYSTVNLSIIEVRTYSSTVEDNSFGAQMGAAFSNGWTSFVEGLQSFILWIASSLPALILFFLIIGAVVFVVMKLVKKKKKAKLPQKQPPQNNDLDNMRL